MKNNDLSSDIQQNVFAEEVKNIRRVVRNGDATDFKMMLGNSRDKDILNSHAVDELSTLNYAAIVGDKEHVLSAFAIPQEEFADFTKVSCAFAIAGLSYSTHDAPLQTEVIKPLLQKSIAAIDFDPKAKEIFLDVLEKINMAEKIKIANCGEIELLKSTVPSHASYFIVESDESGPRRLSYCDSVMNLRRGFGELVFELDFEKIQKLAKKGQENNPLQNNPLQVVKDELFSRESGANFIKSKLIKLVKCHDLEEGEGEEPIVVEKNIPLQPQKRGNCSFKSFNILARAVMQKLHPQEMSFNLEGGCQQLGKGYDIYKKCKKSLQQNAIETLIDFSQEQYRGSTTHAYAVEGLRERVFLQTIVKRNSQLFSRVAEALLKNDVDIFAIKASSGEGLKDLLEDDCRNEYTLLNRPFYNFADDPNRAKEMFASRVNFIGQLMNCNSKEALQNLKSSYLAQGFPANEVDYQGGTLLHQAIKFATVVKIENEQIVSLKDFTVNFERDRTFRSNIIEDRLYFLIHDPEINAANDLRDRNGQTPRMLLDEKFSAEFVKELADKSVTPNARVSPTKSRRNSRAFFYEDGWQL